jgi:hypothetical protein
MSPLRERAVAAALRPVDDPPGGPAYRVPSTIVWPGSGPRGRGVGLATAGLASRGGDRRGRRLNDDGLVDVIGTVKGTPAPASDVVLASSDLLDPDLVDLVDALPPAERYSFAPGPTLLDAGGAINGDPFLTLNVPALRPGETWVPLVRFANPGRVPVTLTPRVLAGAF